MLAKYWLKEVQRRNGGLTDYKLASLLGVSRQYVSQVMKEQHKTLGPRVAISVANQLDGIDPMDVITDQINEKEKLKIAGYSKISFQLTIGFIAMGVLFYKYILCQIENMNNRQDHDYIFRCNRLLTRLFSRESFPALSPRQA